jgi:hypothetical protein
VSSSRQITWIWAYAMHKESIEQANRKYDAHVSRILKTKYRRKDSSPKKLHRAELELLALYRKYDEGLEIHAKAYLESNGIAEDIYSRLHGDKNDSGPRPKRPRGHWKNIGLGIAKDLGINTKNSQTIVFDYYKMLDRIPVKGKADSHFLEALGKDIGCIPRPKWFRVWLRMK